MVRSSYYTPSKHGTGWKRGHPTAAEVNFLNNTNVSDQDKVNFIVSIGAKPPSSLTTPSATTQTGSVSSHGTSGYGTKKIETELNKTERTTHFIINYSKTGLGKILRTF